MCAITDNFTVEQIRDLFDYRDGELFWKIKPSTRVSIGDLAGYHHKASGRLHVRIKNKDCRVHRIIFFMHHGYIPIELDHIDTNPKNNRIENLREATRAENNRNVGVKKTNTSGIKNISWCKRDSRWEVSIKVNGKSKHIGRFDNIKDAEQAAKDARIKYHGSFANHGRH